MDCFLKHSSFFNNFCGYLFFFLSHLSQAIPRNCYAFFNEIFPEIYLSLQILVQHSNQKLVLAISSVCRTYLYFFQKFLPISAKKLFSYRMYNN